eukprot:5225916-Prymnesium_polylepis.4
MHARIACIACSCRVVPCGARSDQRRADAPLQDPRHHEQRHVRARRRELWGLASDLPARSRGEAPGRRQV